MMHPSQHHQMQQAYIQTGPPIPPQDELLFFDRAKQVLENRDTYDDFLKLLSLYSKDVIDTKTLVEKVEDVFMGDADLLAQFRELIDWDDQEVGGGIEWGPPGSIRTGPPEALSAVPVDDGLGPSYRRCPDSVSARLGFLSIWLLIFRLGIEISVFGQRRALQIRAQRRMGLPSDMGIRRIGVRSAQEELVRRGVA